MNGTGTEKRLTRRVRVNVSQSVKGVWTADTTAEVEWSDDGRDLDADRLALALAADLLESAKTIADVEIARRETLAAALIGGAS